MAVSEITSPAASAAPAKHRAAVSTSLPPARGQSFLKLVTTELRKSVDTRSGRVLILAILAIAAAALTWQLTHMDDGRQTFDSYLSAASTGVMLLLPVIGVMAMTSEWTQRTALTTFTLSPRRVRVQFAKFFSAIVLSVVVLTATTLLALAATAIGGAASGNGATYAGIGGSLAGAYLIERSERRDGGRLRCGDRPDRRRDPGLLHRPDRLVAGRPGAVQEQRGLAGRVRRLRPDRRAGPERDAAGDADRDRGLDRAAGHRRTVGKLTSRGEVSTP